MGSSSSKFRKALQKGEEVEAMELYLKNPEIKRNLDPNYNYGENYNNNTLLHYACLYAMKPFIRDFTSEGANDSLKNAFNQTPIHFICMLDRGLDPVKDKQRAECLSLMLYRCRNGDENTADLGAKDHKGNTALHYASRSGLFHCVQLLVANDIPLYEENKDGQTACDCAIQGNFSDIASFLESKMVFSESGPEQEIVDLAHPLQDKTESHRGLCAQDLQEAKDQLLVETADMLQVPLFTADALLRDHEWSREKLVVSWIADPKLACEKAGVRYPEEGDMENTNKDPGTESTDRSQQTCIICTECIESDNNQIVSLSCGHEVCSTCWESYLNIKIKEGDVHNIQCPAYSCKTLVPLETIEGIVSKDMARRYLQNDIKAFVESNPNIKWCPAKGCGRAVRLPLIASSSNAVSSLTQRRLADTPCQVVDCGSGHYFCWHCMQEPHKPCTCELWERWSVKIAEMLPQIPALNDKEDLDECPETEKVANTLWLVTNSKHCPNCKSPIQKTEGCNHMKCTKCKYEFCWVCLELWKKHSSATGGYFRCNRYEIIRKLNIDCVDKIRQATEENMQIQKLNYFLHYYSRFKNHENSFKLEEPLLGAAKEKMTALAVSAVENDASLDGVDTKFVEEAVRELLEARRVLKSSYVYGFFLDGNKEKKTIFELMQTEVEEATESLSQMVARPYLHTPRSKIIQATIFLRNKKQTFLLALSRGLIPDEELPKPFMSKLELLTNPQVSSDDESDEGEDNYSEIRRVIESSIRQQLTGIDTGSPENHPNSRMSNYLEMMCSRSGCPNPRINSDYVGPGQLSYYCCYDCLRIDMRNKRRRRKKRELKEEKMKQAEKMALTQKELENHEEMDLDLMRAIQLSLDCSLTRRRDQPPSNPSSSSSSSGSIDDEHATGSSHDVVGDETSLQKALELSYGYFAKAKPPTQDDELTRAIQMSLEANSLTSSHAENHDEYSSV